MKVVTVVSVETLMDASTQQPVATVIEADSVHFQMCSGGVETFWCGTECLHVGPDSGGRLKSGWRLHSVRGVS